MHDGGRGPSASLSLSCLHLSVPSYAIFHHSDKYRKSLSFVLNLSEKPASARIHHEPGKEALEDSALVSLGVRSQLLPLGHMGPQCQS